MPVPMGNGMPQDQGGSPCWSALKMGFVMGCCVGIGAGSLIGGFSGLRVGLRGAELLSHSGKTAVQSAGTFGTFMGVGMGLRTCLG